MLRCVKFKKCFLKCGRVDGDIGELNVVAGCGKARVGLFDLLLNRG